MISTAKPATTSGTTARIDKTSAPVSFGLLALDVVVVVFVIVGFIVATLTLTTGGRTTAHEDDAVRSNVGAAVDTSFGSIFVEHVETLEGLSEEQLGGMTHGIADLVEQNQSKVTIAVLLANRSTHPIAVETGDYAIFVDGVADPIPPSTSTIQPLTLAPGSSVDVTITFVVPRTGAEISLGYADPDGPAIVLPVGRVDQAPLDISNDHNATVADDGHDH